MNLVNEHVNKSGHQNYWRKATALLPVDYVCVLVCDQNYNKGTETHDNHKESHGGDLYRFWTFRAPFISRRYG
jgi:hypothetical protein